MKEPTKKQLELLCALNPFREDINGTFEEAAKELKTTEGNIKQRMLRLQKRCPEIYEDFRNLRKMLNRDKRNIKNPIVLNPKDIEELERVGKIKEIF